MDSTLGRQLEQAADWLLASQHLVAFTGAGKGVWTRREEVELAEAVQETLERLRPELERAQCALVAEVEPGLWGWVDRLRLEQVRTRVLAYSPRTMSGYSAASSAPPPTTTEGWGWGSIRWLRADRRCWWTAHGVVLC